MQDRSNWRVLGHAVAAAALVVAGPLSAQDDDGVGNSGTFAEGEELYAACTSDEPTETQRCYWYIIGVADTVTLFDDYGWLEPSTCVPKDTTIEELRKVVVDYLDASDRYFSAVSMVHGAFEQAYPCS
jgi:hypothetical protein